MISYIYIEREIYTHTYIHILCFIIYDIISYGRSPRKPGPWRTAILDQAGQEVPYYFDYHYYYCYYDLRKFKEMPYYRRNPYYNKKSLSVGGNPLV